MSDSETVARYGTPLTPAERRVIEAMRECDTYAECAALLGLSTHTIKNHLANARSRLGVRSTRRLEREAIRLGSSGGS